MRAPTVHPVPHVGVPASTRTTAAITGTSADVNDTALAGTKLNHLLYINLLVHFCCHSIKF